MDKGPSSWALQNAMTALMEMRDRLLSEDETIGEDDRLFSDLLDGEDSDNALDILRRVISASIDADNLAKAAKMRKDEIAEREARFRKRRDGLRNMAFRALDCLRPLKLETAEFTASIRNGQPVVVVTDETLLPEAFVRVKREPDKVLIGAALKAGNTVDGAELSNSAPNISIRTR